MAPKIDGYRKLSLEDLVQMRNDLDIVIAEKREAAASEFKAEMVQKAELLGLDLAQIFGGRQSSAKRGPKKGGTAEPKYRNPEDHSQTWAGRGREPRWMTEAIKNKKGKTKDDFLIAA